MCSNNTGSYDLSYFCETGQVIWLKINLTNLQSQSSPGLCQCSLTSSVGIYLYQTVTMYNPDLLRPECSHGNCNIPSNLTIPCGYEEYCINKNIMGNTQEIITSISRTQIGVDWSLQINQFAGNKGLDAEIQLSNKDRYNGKITLLTCRDKSKVII